MEYRGQKIQFMELDKGSLKKNDQEATQLTAEKWHPASDHPWRKSFRNMFPKKQADDSAAALSYR